MWMSNSSILVKNQNNQNTRTIAHRENTSTSLTLERFCSFCLPIVWRIIIPPSFLADIYFLLRLMTKLHSWCLIMGGELEYFFGTAQNVSVATVKYQKKALNAHSDTHFAYSLIWLFLIDMIILSVLRVPFNQEQLRPKYTGSHYWRTSSQVMSPWCTEGIRFSNTSRRNSVGRWVLIWRS